ncbi:MAG: signal peptidase II [Verrucomicrobia bacterium]|nr:signal peptidase II [Verrucomicrobiota bacterium]
MPLNANTRIAATAAVIVVTDQLTKLWVQNWLPYMREFVIIDGFFKLVHWGNTGAAWSLFREHNEILAIISVVALLALFLGRSHFDSGTAAGQVALGLLFGGIIGNLIDRLHADRRHVIDFIRFYLTRREGGEIGFPAFNIADSAICIGVALLFLLSWKHESVKRPSGEASS